MIEQISHFIFLLPIFNLGLLTLVGLTSLKSSEKIIRRVFALFQSLTFLISAIILYQVIFDKNIKLPIIISHKEAFSFGEHPIKFKLILDSTSIYFVVMACTLTNIVGIFSQNYLHNDTSYFRFFYLISLFIVGCIILFTGANFNIIFIGWEIIGITSALLISFFNSRRETVDNALLAFWSYRITDIGLLAASAIIASHLHNFEFSNQYRQLILKEEIIYLIPSLLLLSALGKSAQYPFSSWLPKAMEGPTSSSAIFYGGLSIHAGVYLMLRYSYEFKVPSEVLFVIGFMGLFSASYAALLSKVQSDVKSALGYASISQVGLMFFELSMGWYKLVIIHCVGHAFLRTYQILKSASVIHEFLEYEDSHKDILTKPRLPILYKIMPDTFKYKLYSLAFNLSMNESFGPKKIIIAFENISYAIQNFEERLLKKLSKMGDNDQ